MYGKEMQHGSEDNPEIQALMEMLGMVRKAGMKGGESEMPDGDGDEVLDPATLAVKESDEGGGARDTVDDVDAMVGEQEDEDAEKHGDFDPSEVIEFFGKKSGSDRKPLKGARFGAVEMAMGPAKGFKKKA